MVMQMSWAARRRARQTLRAMQFTGRLEYRLATPPDADGRPGWELAAPSRSPYIAWMGEDGSRSEFMVMVGPLPAIGYTMTMRSGAVLQEWKLAHEGWVYGFGVLVHDDGGLAAHQLAREALATFRWTPPIPHAASLGG